MDIVGSRVHTANCKGKTEDDVYFSDVEDAYYSDEEEENYFSYENIYPLRPKSTGYRCLHKSCSEIMPLVGSVEFFDLPFVPKTKDLYEY